MKKLCFLLLAGTFLIQSCNNGTDDGDNTDSVKITNKEAEAMVQAPDTTFKHNDSTALDAASTSFVMKAANGGLMEVELGQWAKNNSSSSRVKDFGAMMVTDHSKANAELTAMASSKGITLPGKVSTETRMHIDEITAKKGAAFDKAYIDMMVEDHDKDVADFQKAANDLPDNDLKKFAGKTLPVLKKHQSVVKSLKSKM